MKTIVTSGRTLSERTRLATTALVLALVTAVLLVLVQEPAGATFPGKNGKIAFSDGFGASAMNENGSGKQVVTDMYPYELTYSPDGSKIAYTANEDGYDDFIYVMNADGSGLKRLTTFRFGDEGSPAFSPDGSKITFHTDEGYDRAIYVINADGSGLKKLVDTPGDDNSSPVFSPDGERIAFIHSPDPYTIDTGECEKNSVRVMNVDGTGLRDLTGCTQNPISYDPPAWSPNGTKIAFVNWADSDHIYDINVDGPASPRNLTPDSLSASEPSYSPDGSKILYEAVISYGNNDIFVMNANGTGKTNLSNSPGWPVNDWFAVFSPDGTRVAFSSNRDDPDPGSDAGDDIYTVSVSGGTVTRRTSTPNVQELVLDWQALVPETTITSGPSGPTNSTSATFAFSSEAGASFKCSMDGAAFETCASPKSYSSLADGPHTFRVKATDAAGNVDPTPASRSFVVDTVAPTVKSVSPAGKKVSAKTNATATFSEAMEPTTLDGATFKLVKKGATASVPARITYSAATMKATLNPDRRLKAGATYTATISTGVEDAAGNPLAQDRTWMFKVRR